MDQAVRGETREERTQNEEANDYVLPSLFFLRSYLHNIQKNKQILWILGGGDDRIAAVPGAAGGAAAGHRRHRTETALLPLHSTLGPLGPLQIRIIKSHQQYFF